MRRLILDAAKALFVDKGYKNVSVRNIAARIGCSPAALYRHFSSKMEILMVLRNEGFESLFCWQNSLKTEIKTPLERLQAGGLRYVQFAADNPEYYDLMFIHGPISAGDVDSNGPPKRSYDNLKQTVTECLATGRFGDTDIEVATVTFWSMVHGLASLRNSGRLGKCTEGDLTELIRQVIVFSLRPAMGSENDRQKAE